MCPTSKRGAVSIAWEGFRLVCIAASVVKWDSNEAFCEKKKLVMPSCTLFPRGLARDTPFLDSKELRVRCVVTKTRETFQVIESVTHYKAVLTTNFHRQLLQAKQSHHRCRK